MTLSQLFHFPNPQGSSATHNYQAHPTPLPDHPVPPVHQSTVGHLGLQLRTGVAPREDKRGGVVLRSLFDPLGVPVIFVAITLAMSPHDHGHWALLAQRAHRRHLGLCGARALVLTVSREAWVLLGRDRSGRGSPSAPDTRSPGQHLHPGPCGDCHRSPVPAVRAPHVEPTALRQQGQCSGSRCGETPAWELERGGEAGVGSTCELCGMCVAVCVMSARL